MSETHPRARRRYRRRTVRVELEYSSSDGSATATATTLGAGGMFIATRQALPARTKLTVRFSLPGSPERVFEIPASVVWSNATEDARGHALGMGISFEDPRSCASLAAALDEPPASQPRESDAALS